MAILEATDENILKAADIIRAGDLVSFPTETVYGLGADALNPKAAAKIFKAKERPFFDPLIVHISNRSMVDKLVKSVSPFTERIMDKFWPGPLTIVLQKSEFVPDIITSGLETVALRMPSHETALKLIEYSGRPIAAPSANKFSCLSPTKAEHVANQLNNEVEIILDGGPCEIGVESTIIKIVNDEIEILRPGGISIEEIEDFTSVKSKLPGNNNNPEAPGQMPFHYSPGKALRLVDKIIETNDKNAYLFFSKPTIQYENINSRILSLSGDMEEAAANLFRYLHELDALNIEEIIAERIPQNGLGIAIMDRLTKASKKYD